MRLTLSVLVTLSVLGDDRSRGGEVIDERGLDGVVRRMLLDADETEIAEVRDILAVVGPAVFEASAPVRGEGVFHAAADGVARTIGRDFLLEEVVDQGVAIGLIDGLVSPAAGGVDQGAVDGPAETAADAGAEAILRVLAAEAERTGEAALVARTREIAFNAEHELVDLVVVAD